MAAVAAQTLRDFECIVVNDGSSDTTSDVVRKFVRRDTRFRLIEKANSGVADARNVGIDAARAAMIAPLDADDLWHPTYLEKMSAALSTAGPSAAFAYTNSRFIDVDGAIIRSGPAYGITGHALHQALQRGLSGNGSDIMYWRWNVVALGGYDRRLQHEHHAEGSEDYLLQLRLAAKGLIVVVPEYLVGYRLVPGAMSANKVRMANSRLRALEIARTTIDQLDGDLWTERFAFAHVQLGVDFMRAQSYRNAVHACLGAMSLSPASNPLSRCLWLFTLITRKLLVRLQFSRVRFLSRRSEQDLKGRHFLDCDPSAGHWPIRTNADLQRAADIDRKLCLSSLQPALDGQSEQPSA
jgi:glycosyltransferase involved in cell wall biosynthesis